MLDVAGLLTKGMAPRPWPRLGVPLTVPDMVQTSQQGYQQRDSAAADRAKVGVYAACVLMGVEHVGG